jgi:AraC-like DNA-binding protein
VTNAEGGAASGFPAIHFDSRAFPVEQRFANWASMVPAFEVQSLRSGDFVLQAEGWLIGQVVLTFNTMPAVVLERTPAAIAADGRDDYIVVVSRDARWQCSVAHATATEIEPGIVCVLDNSVPFRVQNEAGEIVILNVPRALLDEPRLNFDLHGQLFRNTLAMLFLDFMGALRARLPGLTMAEAPLIERAVRDLLVTCLAAGHEPMTQSAADGAALRRARRYIDANLASALTVADVASAIGVSRSPLYRIFSCVGGVERFILLRRLARARSALFMADGKTTIAEIGFAHGFRSQAHFCRAFKAEFGLAPKQARSVDRLAASSSYGANSDLAKEFRSWFKPSPAPRRLGRTSKS